MNTVSVTLNLPTDPTTPFELAQMLNVQVAQHSASGNTLGAMAIAQLIANLRPPAPLPIGDRFYRETVRVGTSYFVSEAAAVRYYAYEGATFADIRRKVAEGLIHIGKPPLKPGQTLEIIDQNTRYAVVGP